MIMAKTKTEKRGTHIELCNDDLDYPPSFWVEDQDLESPKPRERSKPGSKYPDWFWKLVILFSYMATAELFFVIWLVVRS